MKRQNYRRLLILCSLLLFPITIYYLSPAIIVQAASVGIINGSFIVFIALFLGSMFFGRLFCSYLCPAGGLQECAALINSKNPKQGWKNYIKYVIWAVWFAIILIFILLKRSNLTIDFFYLTDHGISIANIYSYIIYYAVILIMFVPSVIFGKRIPCHYYCWMAPFMVFGMKLGSLLHIKRLRLHADKKACIGCKACDKSCPMSLSVMDKVQQEKMDDSECILCGECIDHCPKKAITYKYN